ncbi:MAG: murein hydrolase activator EnvC family protein [Qipengyuania sp.]
MRRRLLGAVAVCGTLVCVFGAALTPAEFPATAQGGRQFTVASEANDALQRSRIQANRARQRAAAFDQQALQSREASDKARAQAAALAARIQQAEAAIGVAEARHTLVTAELRALDRKLAEKREPVVRLTAALQRLVRRPVVLGLMRPGSLRDTVYLSAVLDSTVPMVRARTAGLRSQIDRAALLQVEAREALASKRANERQLAQRRTELEALAERERLIARRAEGAADREATRAVGLAEEARDLDTLVAQLEAAGSLREQLASLPGPIPRPADPGAADFAGAEQPSPGPTSTSPPARYRLPVDGRIVSGFGERSGAGGRQTGLALIPRGGAQIVAPGAGRVAFAGPYRGYGEIVIIEHANGWTSLVTGLSGLVTRVGQGVMPGSPLGMASSRQPLVTLELRRESEPVNPLEYLE